MKKADFFSSQFPLGAMQSRWGGLLSWVMVPSSPVSLVAGVRIGDRRRILEALHAPWAVGAPGWGKGGNGEDELLLDCILNPSFWHLKNRSWKHVSHLIIFRIKWITHIKLAVPSHSLVHFPTSLKAPWGQRPGPACSLLCPQCLAQSLCWTNMCWLELMPVACVFRKMQNQFSFYYVYSKAICVKQMLFQEYEICP